MGNLIGQWNDIGCDSVKGFICKRQASSAIDHPPAVPMCEAEHDNFESFDDNCYLYVDTPKNWDEAEQDCVGRQAHLVSILDSKEQAFVLTHLDEMSDTPWIGLSNSDHNNYYEWSDGWPVVFSDWNRVSEIHLTLFITLPHGPNRSLPLMQDIADTSTAQMDIGTLTIVTPRESTFANTQLVRSRSHSQPVSSTTYSNRASFQHRHQRQHLVNVQVKTGWTCPPSFATWS